MNCKLCGLPLEKGQRVREDFYQTVFTKEAREHEPTEKHVMATYWGAYRGEEHDPVSLMHAACYRNR